MYKIDYDSIQKLSTVHNLLNELEIRGISNLRLLLTSIVSIQEIIKNIEDLNKQQSISIDNTKGG